MNQAVEQARQQLVSVEKQLGEKQEAASVIHACCLLGCSP